MFFSKISCQNGVISSKEIQIHILAISVMKPDQIECISNVELGYG